jgi:hypothetical protein
MAHTGTSLYLLKPLQKKMADADVEFLSRVTVQIPTKCTNCKHSKSQKVILVKFL